MLVKGWIIVEHTSVVGRALTRATRSIGSTLGQRSWVWRRRQNIGPIGVCWLGCTAGRPGDQSSWN